MDRAPLDSNSPEALDRIGLKLQREIVLLFAWGPAILLQLAHPLVARGIADHSAFLIERQGRMRRFHRTLRAMLHLCFGTEQQARVVAARIKAIHRRVNGQLPETAGVFPAGTAYSARDPALLAWVHATLIDMNLRVYELYVEPLPVEDKDRYCAEASAIEELLDLPPGRLPRSFIELHRYIGAMHVNGEIVVTDVARTLAHAIVYPSVPRVAWPLISLIRLNTVGLLPPVIREGYRFPWDSRSEAGLRRSAGVVRNLLPLMPSIVRHWPAARRAIRRAHAGTRRSRSTTC